MRLGRAKPPLLGEIGGPAERDGRLWSLRRADFAALDRVLPRLEGRRAVLVTGGAEETVVLAVALAGVASASGRRTALLECDLRRPRLAAELGLAPGPGVHEYLRWEASAAQLLQPLVLAGAAAGRGEQPLVCIAAGREAADPGTLLGLQSFAHMAGKLRRAYELLVLAGPPLGDEEAPLSAVAGRADCVLAGLAPEQAGRRARRAVHAALGRLPSPALGAVLVGAA